MEYDDNFAAGFIQLFILLICVFVLPWLELGVVSAILGRTTNRKIILGIPALIILTGFFFVRDSAGLIVVASLVLIGPMAAVTPAFAVTDLVRPGGRFLRILFSFFAVTLFGMILILVFIAGVPADSAFFRDNLLVNLLLYAVIVVLDTLVAYGAYLLMGKVRPQNSAGEAGEV